MRTKEVMRSEPLLSKRRLGWAGIAAFVGCAACCALPLLAAAVAGSGAAATATSILKPGSELVVGLGVFAAALTVMAVRAGTKRKQGCADSCKADGQCCERGARST